MPNLLIIQIILVFKKKLSNENEGDILSADSSSFGINLMDDTTVSDSNEILTDLSKVSDSRCITEIEKEFVYLSWKHALSLQVTDDFKRFICRIMQNSQSSSKIPRSLKRILSIVDDEYVRKFGDTGVELEIPVDWSL